MRRPYRAKNNPSKIAPLIRAVSRRPALSIFLFGILALLLIAGLGYPLINRTLPNIEDVNAIAKRQTTLIYAADGSNLSMLFRENRTIVPLSKISPKLRNAVVAIEDERFYKHKGIDYTGILRAAVRDVASREVAEGGSTITQQYVKNAYFSPERTLTRKLKEAMLAYRLEKNFTKEQILVRYLNTIYLGDGAYGVETASRTYFGKPASDLSLAESATIAGLIRAPEVYNPHRNPKTALKRRNIVLEKMVSLGLASEKEAAWAKSSALGMVPKKPPAEIAPYFVEWVKESLANRFDSSMLYSQGLRIYTTLDPKIQHAAEKAATSRLNQPGDPDVAVVAIEPSTGAVKAVVGGRDFSKQKFNLATQGRRQPGSAFKPFTLAAAMLEGASPDLLYDSSSPQSFQIDAGKVWKVRNYSGYGGGKIDLWRATAISSNVVFAKVIVDVGAKKVADLAKNAGITTPINTDPAIALGGLKDGVSPLEMASAYATFANSGVHLDPFGVTKVTTAEGKLLYEHKANPKRAMEESVAYLVTKALKNVIDWGTGTAAYINRPAAGKTGTTDDYSDAWFVGYTPDLSVAVWVGYRDVARPMKDIRGISVTGGTFPAKIWGDFMASALKGTETRRFPDPPRGTLVSADICTDNGKLASEYCPNVKASRFLKKFRPKKYCSDHPGVIVPDVVGKELGLAASLLESDGFKWTTERRISSSPANTVIEENPRGGEKAKQGATIALIVSAGKTSVPLLIGLTEEGAVKELEGVGLKAAKKYAASAKPDGTVVNQDPPAGRPVEPGSTVTLTISKATPSEGEGGVPNIIGKSSADARLTLEKAGYAVKSEQVTNLNQIEQFGFDVVVSQTPTAGTSAPKGSTVTIYVTPIR